MKHYKQLLAIILIIAMLPLNTSYASAASEFDEITYFDDGSYTTIKITFFQSRNGNSISANKTATHYNSLDVVQWSATLYATFTFDGTEYWATASSISVNIQNNTWYEISKSASHSGCGATGEVTMGQKFLGVTVNKESVTITLSCSPYGVIR